MAYASDEQWYYHCTYQARAGSDDTTVQALQATYPDDVKWFPLLIRQPGGGEEKFSTP